MSARAPRHEAAAPGTEGRPMIEVAGLHKYFGTMHVLQGLDATIERGSVAALMGPSGSGKSTFLRCLNRLEEPSAGTVLIEGVDITDVRIDINRVRSEIGMVFQDYNLFPHLTALQNVTLGPRYVSGLSRREAEDRARRHLERVGLADKADARPPSLSGGQNQRVAIARSLAMEPKMLLFDEPTSALDPEMVHEVLDVMRDLAEEGMTMVVVSHEIGFLKQASDVVFVLESGRIIERGAPRQVFDDPQHPRTQEFLRRIL